MDQTRSQYILAVLVALWMVFCGVSQTLPQQQDRQTPQSIMLAVEPGSSGGGGG